AVFRPASFIACVSRIHRSLRVNSSKELLLTLERTGTAAGIIDALETAWNDGDSLRFASYFAEDADLVNIHGMRVLGRGSIAGLYGLLFRSVFANSRLTCSVNRSRMLCQDAALVQVKVRVRAGQAAGDHDVVASIILQRENQEWQVASLHNTRVGPASF